MDINDLNKTQLILVALLLSFVTSIATGIVTVSLMEQAPPGVTQTINRVVERTVQVVEPQKETQVITEQIVIRENDLIARAIDANRPGFVSLYTKNTTAESGPEIHEVASAFVMQSNGLVVTSDSVAGLYGKVPVFAQYQGQEYETRLVSFDQEQYVALVQLVSSSEIDTEENFETVSFEENATLSLGKSVVAIDTTRGTRIGAGMITAIEMENVPSESTNTQDSLSEQNKKIKYIHTSIDGMGDGVEGGPLMLTNGSIVGMSFVSRDGNILAIPISAAEKMLAIVSEEGIEASVAQSMQMASTISFDTSLSEKSTNSAQTDTIDATE